MSCVSCGPYGPIYTQGPADLSKSAMFVLKSEEKSLLRNSSYVLGEIDGVARGPASTFPNGEKGIAVPPGEHQITVAMFHSSPESGGGMVTAEAMIPLKVETGTVYEPTGSVFGKQRADFWIRERGTGTKASKVVSVVPKSFGPYVGPLILPAD